MTRNALPKNYARPSALLEDATADWTVASGPAEVFEFVDTPAAGAYGSTVLHFQATVGDTKIEADKTSLSHALSHAILHFLVYVPDYTNINTISVFAGTSGLATSAYKIYDIASNAFLQHNGWHNFILTPPNATADDWDWKTLEELKIRVNCDAGEMGEVYVDSVWAGGREQPQLLFIFDDAVDDQYDAVKATGIFDAGLDTYGFKGCFSIADTFVDGANRLTSAELLTLISEGHDVIVHGDQGWVNDLTTDAARAADFELNAAAVDALGGDRRFYVYVGGERTAGTDALLLSLGVKVYREISTPSYARYGPILTNHENTAYGPLLRIGRIGWEEDTQSLAAMQGLIDDLVTNGGSAAIMLHDFVESGPTGTEVDSDSFETLLSYINDYKNQMLLDVVTISEWYAGLAGGRLSVETGRIVN